MPMTTLARGNALSTTYIGVPLTPVSVASFTSEVQTFNISGLITTDIIAQIGLQGGQIAGIVIGECDCLTDGVLSVQLLNVTAAAIVPTAGTYVFQVVRADGPLPANMS